MQNIKIPGGRALVAANLFTAPGLWDEQEFAHKFRTSLESTKRRAGISDPHQITLTSVDQVGRSPVTPPRAIYPLSPEMCASLIADAAFFYVSMSSVQITDALARQGLTAAWLQPLNEHIDKSRPVLQIDKVVSHRNGMVQARRATMNFSEMNRLLIELVDLDMWAKHAAILMGRSDLIGVPPWPYFSGEREVWV